MTYRPEWLRWMGARPVKVSDLLSWIENEEIGLIEHSPAVQQAVDQWVSKNVDFEPGISVTREELTAALCDGGMRDVEELVRNRLWQAASMGMVWGGITAFQRLVDPRVEPDQITAE